ncbi:hypothetical protein BG011_003940 [Mortierella polycephala]|uniref:Uncharacterized protein n=1 Tax=Mortierella polycephala TaxID=41804 RepID=A0A9P6U3D8_9FUNG|nr:hypothetical protein BG011_003940 [Mortierella polycephala]
MVHKIHLTCLNATLAILFLTIIPTSIADTQSEPTDIQQVREYYLCKGITCMTGPLRESEFESIAILNMECVAKALKYMSADEIKRGSEFCQADAEKRMGEVDKEKKRTVLAKQQSCICKICETLKAGN